jgi:hypothetical protein
MHKTLGSIPAPLEEGREGKGGRQGGREKGRKEGKKRNKEKEKEKKKSPMAPILPHSFNQPSVTAFVSLEVNII